MKGIIFVDRASGVNLEVFSDVIKLGYKIVLCNLVDKVAVFLPLDASYYEKTKE